MLNIPLFLNSFGRVLCTKKTWTHLRFQPIATPTHQYLTSPLLTMAEWWVRYWSLYMFHLIGFTRSHRRELFTLLNNHSYLYCLCECVEEVKDAGDVGTSWGLRMESITVSDDQPKMQIYVVTGISSTGRPSWLDCGSVVHLIDARSVRALSLLEPKLIS